MRRYTLAFKHLFFLIVPCVSRHGACSARDGVHECLSCCTDEHRHGMQRHSRMVHLEATITSYKLVHVRLFGCTTWYQDSAECIRGSRKQNLRLETCVWLKAASACEEDSSVSQYLPLYTGFDSYCKTFIPAGGMGLEADARKNKLQTPGPSLVCQPPSIKPYLACSEICSA
jgi:hypothetical protein